MNRRDFLKAPAGLLAVPAMARDLGVARRIGADQRHTPTEEAGEPEAYWGYCSCHSPEDRGAPCVANAVYGHQLSFPVDDPWRRRVGFAAGMLMTNRRNCRTVNGAADPNLLCALSRTDLFLAMANPVEPRAWAMALKHCEVATSAGALSILFVPDTYAGEPCDIYLYNWDTSDAVACVLRYVARSHAQPLCGMIVLDLFSLLISPIVDQPQALWISSPPAGFRRLAECTTPAARMKLLRRLSRDDQERSLAQAWYSDAITTTFTAGGVRRPITWAAAEVLTCIAAMSQATPLRFEQIRRAFVTVCSDWNDPEERIWSAIMQFQRYLPNEVEMVVCLRDIPASSNYEESFSAFVMT